MIRGCGEVVTVDYDVPFEGFKGSVFEEWILKRARKMGGWAYCRPSPSGNTHCIICISQRSSLSEEERLALSIYFLDDPARIFYNLRRLILLGRMHDRLFLQKMKWIPEPL